jgi:hypothetical protein
MQLQTLHRHARAFQSAYSSGKKIEKAAQDETVSQERFHLEPPLARLEAFLL